MASAEIGFHVRRIEFPPCQDPSYPVPPIEINSRGQVCGYLNGCWWLEGPITSLWDPETGEMQSIYGLPGCAPPDTDITLRDMNDSGHLAGYDDGQDCQQEGWFWSPETGSVGLGFLPGGSQSSARAINSLDQVIGRAIVPGGYRATIWSPSTELQELPGCEGCGLLDINDSTWIIGDMLPSGAFLWTPEDGRMTLQERTGGALNPGTATRINNLGHVVGPWPGAREFYIWDPQAGFQLIEGFGSVPDWFVAPTDINDRGEVVGYVGGDNEVNPVIAFHWDARRGFRHLEPLIDPCADYGQASRLYGQTAKINNRGHIAIAPNWGPAWVLTPYIPGDVDEDEDCDLQDLAYLLANFGTESGATYADGDLDCNENVDLQDLAILLSNFGETLP